jgi:hypothetical protein
LFRCVAAWSAEVKDSMSGSGGLLRSLMVVGILGERLLETEEVQGLLPHEGFRSWDLRHQRGLSSKPSWHV